MSRSLRWGEGVAPATLGQKEVSWANLFTGWRLVGLTAVAIVAILAAMPLGAPWWTMVDSDGAYLGNGATLLAGRGSNILDHPALGLQQALAYTLGVDWAARSALGGADLGGYLHRTMTDMDQALPILRAFGLFGFLLGAASCMRVVYRLGARAGEIALAGLLYCAIPGHLQYAIHFRPENYLAAACLLSVYLLIRGRERHSTWAYILGALVVGLGLNTKVHAIGLTPVLLFALWDNRIADYVGSLRTGWCEWRKASPAAAPFLAFALLMVALVGYIWRPAPAIDAKLVAALIVMTFAVAASCWMWRAAGRRSLAKWLVHPLAMLMGVGVVVGCFGPCIGLADQARPLFWQLVETLTGHKHGGAASAGSLFSGVQDYAAMLANYKAILVVILLAALPTYALFRGDWKSRYWLIGAAGMLVPALLRGPHKASVHYLAPTLVMLIPPTLTGWRLAAERLQGRFKPRTEVAGKIAAALVVAMAIATPCWATVEGKYRALNTGLWIERGTQQLAASLPPNEVILHNYGALDREASHFMLVREYCPYAPVISKRSFPDTPTALQALDANHKLPAIYVIGGSASPDITFEGDGFVRIQSAWGDVWRAGKLDTGTLLPPSYAAYRIIARDYAPDADVRAMETALLPFDASDETYPAR